MKRFILFVTILFVSFFIVSISAEKTHAQTSSGCLSSCTLPPDPQFSQSNGSEQVLLDCLAQGCTFAQAKKAIEDYYNSHGGFTTTVNADGSITYFCANLSQVTIKQIFSCGTECSTPADCASAKNGCTACVPNGDGTSSCKTPPACGTDCTNNPTVCSQSADGCSACTPNSDGTSSCKTPPACGTDCSANPNICSNAAGGCSVCGADKKCSAPACGTDCSTNPNICANATGGCNACVPSGTGGSVCATTPACGTSCAGNPNICQQAGGGCSFCDGTTNQCTAPPACGVSCGTSAYCAQGGGQCSVCSQGKCAVDDYNPLACTCDGLQTTALFSGQKATFTAFAKVLGTDITKASVKDIVFKVFAGNKLIATSSAIPAVVSVADSTKVQYKATWDYTIPSDATPGVQYSVIAEEHCQRAQPITLNTSNPSRVVLAAAVTPVPTSAPSFFDTIGLILKNFFGLNASSNTPSTPGTPTPTLDPQKKASLQIQTFYQGHVTESSCTNVKFTFGGVN